MHRIVITVLVISAIGCEQSYWVQPSVYDRYQALPDTEKDRAALDAERVGGGERVYVRARDLRLDPLDPVNPTPDHPLPATVRRTHPLVWAGLAVALASAMAIGVTGYGWSQDRAEQRANQEACRQAPSSCLLLNIDVSQAWAALLAIESASVVAGTAMSISGARRHPAEVAGRKPGIVYVNAAEAQRSKHPDGKTVPPPALSVPTLPVPP